MEFEWDADKAASNLSKHGVDFAQAMTVFGDPLEVVIASPGHSDTEWRFLSIGLSEAGRLLVVAYTERDERIGSLARGRLPRRSGDSVSQRINPEADEDMLAEYDFSQGVRGKHHQAYKAGTNVIFLEPDLAKVFGDSALVNRVLRLLLNLAKENVSTNRPSANEGMHPTAQKPGGG